MDVDWRPAAPRKGVLRHLVCYKFEEGTAEEDKLARVDGFAELIEAVGTVRSFEWGTNNSPVRGNPLSLSRFVGFVLWLPSSALADKPSSLPPPPPPVPTRKAREPQDNPASAQRD